MGEEQKKYMQGKMPEKRIHAKKKTKKKFMRKESVLLILPYTEMGLK